MRMLRLTVYLLTVLLLLNITAQAQKGVKPKADNNIPKYICLMCKVGADKAGKCPICTLQMAKAGVYVCTGCGAMADKPGDCQNCKRPMVKLSSLAKKCKVCGYYSDKNKKECPVCEHHKKMKKK
jgi:rubrerythrin